MHAALFTPCLHPQSTARAVLWRAFLSHVVGGRDSAQVALIIVIVARTRYCKAAIVCTVLLFAHRDCWIAPLPNSFSALSETEKFCTRNEHVRGHDASFGSSPSCIIVIATVHLPTLSLIHRYPLLLLAGPTSARRCHTISRDTAISEISALHRSSPPATQQTNKQTNNNMPPVSLDLERWRASEVVLLDIGKSMRLHCSSPLCATILLRRERLQPSLHQPLSCMQPSGARLGLASNHPKHSRQQRRDLRSGSRCVAALSRALATPGSAHATEATAIHTCLICTFLRLQPLRGTMLTTCLSLRRGHHLEHLLCQGCHGKRLRLRTSSLSRLALRSSSRVLRLPRIWKRDDHLSREPTPGRIPKIVVTLRQSSSHSHRFSVLSPDVGCCFHAILVVSASRHATRRCGCLSPVCSR